MGDYMVMDDEMDGAEVGAARREGRQVNVEPEGVPEDMRWWEMAIVLAIVLGAVAAGVSAVMDAIWKAGAR